MTMPSVNRPPHGGLFAKDLVNYEPNGLDIWEQGSREPDVNRIRTEAGKGYLIGRDFL
jgi:hypothetical protein